MPGHQPQLRGAQGHLQSPSSLEMALLSQLACQVTTLHCREGPGVKQTPRGTCVSPISKRALRQVDGSDRPG